jgi:predicted O-methyltransferase YrrM
MKGTPEEEIGRGARNKYEVLLELHRTLRPRTYLEIGVQKGRSLRLADFDCLCVGVDPETTLGSSRNVAIYQVTSDQFFSVVTEQTPAFDLAFIDGLHLFEQALRDFMNVERVMKPEGLIVMDDIFPAHPAQAERVRRTQKWAGDVWKVLKILQEHRPDLILTPLDASPTGMLLVDNLNPSSRVLEGIYSGLVEEWLDRAVPEDIIERRGACTQVRIN